MYPMTMSDGIEREMTQDEKDEWDARRSMQPLTEGEVIAMYEQAVDQHIDTGARAYGYMSILTAISYAEEPAVPQFQTEGQALRAWRSLCYAKCHQVLAAVKAQERAQPTVAQLLGEMPAIDLPPPGFAT